MWPFKTKKTAADIAKDPRANYSFDDEDRQHAVLMRGMNRDMRRMEMEMQRLRMKKDLQDLKDELYDGDDQEDEEKSGGIEDQLMSQLLGTVMAGKSVNNVQFAQQPQQQQPQQLHRQEMTDDEIRNFLGSQDKKMLKMAKALPIGMLRQQISQKIQLTDGEFERGYKILTEEY